MNPAPVNWDAVKAYYLETRSYKAVCERFGVPIGSVKSRAHREGWSEGMHCDANPGMQGMQSDEAMHTEPGMQGMQNEPMHTGPGMQGMQNDTGAAKNGSAHARRLLFCLPNLASSAVSELEPWHFRNGSTPAGVSKDEFRRWCALPTTQSLFFSGFEGTHAGLRVAETNPAVFMHAVVADFDSPVTKDEREAFLRRASPQYPPNYIASTFSGNVRLVWLFSAQVSVFGSKLTEAFLKKTARELGLKKIFPALDEEAFFSSSQYYQCGHDWQLIHDTPLPAALLHSWLLAVSKKADWSSYGDKIPISRVADEIDARFPGKWSGPFEEGARGARFWDPSADNPTAAIVRSTGMQCFTGPKPFVSWGEIFGRKFVEAYRADTVGAAIEGIWFDGRDYWRKVDSAWRLFKRQDITLHLRVSQGISDDRPKGASASQMDEVLNQIQQVKSVDGAAPFIYRKEDSIWFASKRYLNISRCRPVVSNDAPQPWGVCFPYVAELLDGYFDPPEQLPFFLSWLAYAYQNALAGRPRNGQAVFLAGDVNQGKTLLSNLLVSELLGGHVDASDFLLGESKFNKELFEVGLWTVDDTVPSSDPRKQQLYSAMLKKIPANYSFQYQPKFRDQLMLPWAGRVIITCNADPESIRILPDVEMSLLDKVMLFKIGTAERDFTDVASRIRADLPGFARFLQDYVIPAACLGDARFGVKCYHHPELLEEARQSGRTAGFAELLEMFKASIFADPSRDEWSGTATLLLSEMMADEITKHVASKYTPEQLGRRLNQLKAQGYPIAYQRCSGLARTRLWIITRDDRNPDMEPF